MQEEQKKTKRTQDTCFYHNTFILILGYFLRISLLSMGYAFGSYASFRITYQIALQWFIFAMFEYIIAGIGVALVFGKKK